MPALSNLPPPTEPPSSSSSSPPPLASSQSVYALHRGNLRKISTSNDEFKKFDRTRMIERLKERRAAASATSNPKSSYTPLDQRTPTVTTSFPTRSASSPILQSSEVVRFPNGGVMESPVLTKPTFDDDDDDADDGVGGGEGVDAVESKGDADVSERSSGSGSMYETAKEKMVWNPSAVRNGDGEDDPPEDRSEVKDGGEFGGPRRRKKVHDGGGGGGGGGDEGGASGDECGGVEKGMEYFEKMFGISTSSEPQQTVPQPTSTTPPTRKPEPTSRSLSIIQPKTLDLDLTLLPNPRLASALHSFSGVREFGELTFERDDEMLIWIEDMSEGWSLGSLVGRREEEGQKGSGTDTGTGEEDGKGLVPRGWYRFHSPASGQERTQPSSKSLEVQETTLQDGELPMESSLPSAADSIDTAPMSKEQTPQTDPLMSAPPAPSPETPGPPLTSEPPPTSLSQQPDTEHPTSSCPVTDTPPVSNPSSELQLPVPQIGDTEGHPPGDARTVTVTGEVVPGSSDHEEIPDESSQSGGEDEVLLPRHESAKVGSYADDQGPVQRITDPATVVDMGEDPSSHPTDVHRRFEEDEERRMSDESIASTVTSNTTNDVLPSEFTSKPPSRPLPKRPDSALVLVEADNEGVLAGGGSAERGEEVVHSSADPGLDMGEPKRHGGTDFQQGQDRTEDRGMSADALDATMAELLESETTAPPGTVEQGSPKSSGYSLPRQHRKPPPALSVLIIEDPEPVGDGYAKGIPHPQSEQSVHPYSQPSVRPSRKFSPSRPPPTLEAIFESSDNRSSQEIDAEDQEPSNTASAASFLKREPSPIGEGPEPTMSKLLAATESSSSSSSSSRLRDSIAYFYPYPLFSPSTSSSSPASPSPPRSNAGTEKYPRPMPVSGSMSESFRGASVSKGKLEGLKATLRGPPRGWVGTGAEAWIMGFGSSLSASAEHSKLETVSECSRSFQDEDGTIKASHLRRSSSLPDPISSTADGRCAPGSENQAMSEDEDDIHHIGHGPRWIEKAPRFQVSVHSPEKRSTMGGIKEFTVFFVTSTFPAMEDGGDPVNITVERRYSHFAQLDHLLRNKFPAIYISALPAKQYAGRFSAEFVETRRRDLHRWIGHIVRHPVLRSSKAATWFLGCEDDTEFRAQLAELQADPVSGSAFFANVYHPEFNVDVDEAEDTMSRFAKHVRAVEQGGAVKECEAAVSKMREGLKDASLHLRSVAQSMCRMISGLNLPAVSTDEIEGTDGASPDQLGSDLESKRRRAKALALQNDEGAWCWKESCPECLSLTKALQGTAESLACVAGLYEENAREDLLATQELLRETSHPHSHRLALLDAHRETLAKAKYLNAAEDEESGLTASELPANKEDIASRCETVLNVTMSEVEQYHAERNEDFKRFATEYLDRSIEMHEQILLRLRLARSHFEHGPYTTLASTGPRLPSWLERDARPIPPLPQPSNYGVPGGPTLALGRPMSVVGEVLVDGMGTILRRSRISK